MSELHILRESGYIAKEKKARKTASKRMGHGYLRPESNAGARFEYLVLARYVPADAVLNATMTARTLAMIIVTS